MIKKLLILAVIVAFAWSIPAARQRMARMAEPVVERMGPVVANPIRRYNTRNELVVLMRELTQEYQARVPLPNARNFQAWLERNTLSGRDGKDAWGNAYFLRQDRVGITIGSPGEDGQVGTEDDITRTLTF
jgi:hypothetical protein